MPLELERLELDHPDLQLNGAPLQARAAQASRTEAPRLQRLWQYYRNPMTAGDAQRPYRQAQEWGLPARITGANASSDVARKEVVIENDIGWRVDAMVELRNDSGQPVKRPPKPAIPVEKPPTPKRPRPYRVKALRSKAALPANIAVSQGRAGMTVGQRFDGFLANIKITDKQHSDGRTAHQGVRRNLNYAYHGWSSETANSMLTGSWGKDTEVRPTRDIDVLFILPDSMKTRFTSGNKQSQILQHVKNTLLNSYPQTDIRGDGPVVKVPLTAYEIEVVPAFKRYDNKYDICLTNNGGSYKAFDPLAEIANVSASSAITNGNTRPLVRMLKKWQTNCTVPMKSFWLELLAVEFLSTYEHKDKSTTWYDWMVRDFFKWLATKGNSSWNFLTVPGTYESMSIGNAWASKAQTARDRAIKATENEANNYPCTASEEWQKIFGNDVPSC